MLRFYTFLRHYSLTIAIIGVIYGLAVNEQLGKLCAGVAILLFGMLFVVAVDAQQFKVAVVQ